MCAPNGSGKTAIAELAVLRHFENTPEAKAVYITPMEDMATKVYADWKRRLEPAIGHTIVLLTGEQTMDLKLAQRGQLIISTPERWDNISRRWKQRKSVQNVKLFIADDLHMIGASNGVSRSSMSIEKFKFKSLLLF